MADEATQQRSLHNWVQAMYGLHALALVSVLAGTLLGTAWVFALPSALAVAMNLLRAHRARDTVLDCHFRWQRRTAGWTLVAVVTATLVLDPWVLMGVGSTLLLTAYGAIGAWAAWRIGSGWLALRNDHAP